MSIVALCCAACALAGAAWALPPTVCTNTEAIATGQGGTSTTPTTATCTDGTTCGYVVTYNPLIAQCQPKQGKCCLSQQQYSYHQPYSCKPKPKEAQVTTCTAGKATATSGVVGVYVTAPCGTNGAALNCDTVPTWVPPEEGSTPN